MESVFELPARGFAAPADRPWRRATDSVRRLLFGHDVFISYARADALEYAQALADALTRYRVSAYIDQLGSPPGPEVPQLLLLRLRLSSMMVLVGSSGAALSQPVAREVAEFTRRNNRLFVVEVEDALSQAGWYRRIKGGPARRITAAELADGVPSEAVVQQVLKNIDFGRREDRLRRTMRYTIAGVGLILTTGAAGVALAREQAGRSHADALRARAELEMVQDSVRAARAAASTALEAAADARSQSARADSIRRLAEAGALDASAAAQAARDSVAALVKVEEALSIAGRATSTLDTSKVTVAQSLLLTVESLRTAWTPQGAGAWLRAISRVSEPLTVRRAHDARVRALAVSADGARVASGAEDGTVLIWRIREDPDGGVEFIPRFVSGLGSASARGVVGALAFSPDGRMLAVQHGARAELWQVDGAAPVQRLSRSFLRTALSFTFSPDGRMLAVVGDDRVEVVDTRDGRVTRLRNGPGALRVSFSESGRLLAIAGETVDTARNETPWIELWDAPSGVRTARVDSVSAGGLSFSGDTAVYTNTNTWIVWRSNQVSGMLVPTAHREWPPDPSARVRLTLGALLIESDYGEDVTLLVDPTVTAWDPRGRWIVAGAADGTISLLPSAPNSESLFVPADSARAMALSHDGRWLALSVGPDTAATVRVVEVATGRDVMRDAVWARRVGFSRDGRWLLAGGDKTVRIYSTAGWGIAHVLRTPGSERDPDDDRPRGAPFLSPDGRQVAIVNVDVCERGEAYVWEVDTGAPVAACRPGQQWGEGGTDASPDTLISWPLLGDPEGWAAGLARTGGSQLQDPSTGREIMAMVWPDRVEAFSSGGEWLATLFDHGVSLWRIGRPEPMIAEACARLSRNLSPGEWRREFPYQSYRVTCPGLPVPSADDPES